MFILQHFHNVLFTCTCLGDWRYTRLLVRLSLMTPTRRVWPDVMKIIHTKVERELLLLMVHSSITLVLSPAMQKNTSGKFSLQS